MTQLLNWNVRGSAATFFLLATCFVSATPAGEGDPMAVRSWPGNAVTLETHWGHTLTLVSGEVEAAKDADFSLDAAKAYDHVVSRLPNEDKTKVSKTGTAKKDANAVHIKTLGEAGPTAPQLIRVDGISILLATIETEFGSGLPENIDLLVVSGPALTTAGAQHLASQFGSVKVSRVLLNTELADDAKSMIEGADTIDLVDVSHNTLALAANNENVEKMSIIRLANKPWEMPAELASEFDAMEESCKNSQEVFAKLSVEQMNFKPSNGTHTPRWNTEHMMGRQLGFFSQLYHTVDPAMPVQNLNPQQMPPKYKFANPTWSGKEEARQMQRVSDYTRRFAYLLEGKKLTDKATGTFWPSIGALLKQMQVHYGEHTANTVKKFDLPGFPKS